MVMQMEAAQVVVNYGSYTSELLTSALSNSLAVSEIASMIPRQR